MLAIENSAMDQKRIVQRNKNSVKRKLSMEKSFSNNPSVKKEVNTSLENNTNKTAIATTPIFEPFDDIEL